jgi:hypothetical protein
MKICDNNSFQQRNEEKKARKVEKIWQKTEKLFHEKWQ